jgi:hypothetical protein
MAAKQRGTLTPSSPSSPGRSRRRPCATRSPGWLSGPARTAGPTRSSWRPACNARSPPDRPTAARAASAPPGSPRGKAWRSSTSTTPAASTATPSPTWAPWTSSPPRTTWSSSAHPAPARPILRSGSVSGPARPATAWRSPPPPGGSPAWLTPMPPAACKPSWSALAATRCWWSTRWAVRHEAPCHRVGCETPPPAAATVG